jgi:hypothetical protein
MPRIWFVLACGLVALVTACGGGSEDDGTGAGDAAPSETTTPATTTVVESIDDSEFCDIFRGLSARRQDGEDGLERYEDEAAWTQGIERVERIVASAPGEIASQAATYLELVEARRDLAASYGYEPVPADVKLQFGREHAAMQQQANELIAFAKDECSGVE